jgi:ABC-type glycerol-3-phosphate transport system permease component
VIWTISTAVGAILALAAYSFLSYAMARLAWRERGMPLVLIAIFLCAQIWLVGQLVTALILGIVVPPYWLLTANWSVSASAIVLLWFRFKDDGRERFDSARMDGCGAMKIYWHIVLPLVRPILFLLVLFTLVTGALDLLTHTGEFEIVRGLHFYAANVPVLLAGSTGAVLSLFAIFFLVKKLMPPTRSGALQSAD